jgi:hypothetical protein
VRWAFMVMVILLVIAMAINATLLASAASSMSASWPDRTTIQSDG